MFLELFKNVNELNKDEYLLTMENQSIFTKKFNDYILDLRMNKKCIESELAGEMYVYQHLQLPLDENNLEKIEQKILKLIDYAESYKLKIKAERSVNGR